MSDSKTIKKQKHLGVRIDYANSCEIFYDKILSLLLHPRHSRLYILNFSLFWQILFSSHKKKILEEASLVLIDSKLISWGIKFLTGSKVPIISYRKFYEYLIRLRYKYSLVFYIWGGSLQEVDRILVHLSSYQTAGNSFLGGSGALYKKNETDYQNILQSLIRFSPHLLIIGEGFSFEFLWKNRKKIQANLSLYSPQMFSSMASKVSFSSTNFYLTDLVKYFLSIFNRPFTYLLNLLKVGIYVFFIFLFKIKSYFC